jgi:hypothetical protein
MVYFSVLKFEFDYIVSLILFCYLHEADFRDGVLGSPLKWSFLV